jgi:hypothetical protein
MPCNKLAVGEGRVTVDPNILHENPQAKVALASLAMQALKSTFETHRGAQAAEWYARAEEGRFSFNYPHKAERISQACEFYPSGWSDGSSNPNHSPEWFMGPVTIRLNPDGSFEYRDGDWFGNHPGKLTAQEVQHFAAQMDTLIPQLAMMATQESIVQKVASIAPIQSDQWVSPTTRVLTITL